MTMASGDSHVAVTLNTLAGGSYHFSVPSKLSTFESKCEVADELGRPADLQRWILNGTILEDVDLLANYVGPLDVLCVFLPRTFEVKVKVIKFTPGSQAQSVEEVCIKVSPTLTVDAAKLEALSAAIASLGDGSADIGSAARLIKGGLHLKDEKTMEHYHIDPDSTLHLIIPRGRGDTALPESTSIIASNVSADVCNWGAQERNSDDIIMQGSQAEKEDSKGSLSPRTKEAASMFTSMGVHRLRPRRSASAPVFKSRRQHEGSCENNEESSTNANVQTQIEGKASGEAPQIATTNDEDFGRPSGGLCNGHELTDADIIKSLFEETVQPQNNDAPCVTCTPQKPHEPRLAPSRPSRGRAASRATCHRTTDDQPSTPSSPVGMMRPAKAPVCLRRPPAMPCSRQQAVSTRCGTSNRQEPEPERPTSRGQRSSNATAPRPCSQGSPAVDPSSPSLWVQEWAPQAGASIPKGQSSSHNSQKKRSWGARAHSERAPMRRSSSCGIDRWHSVARQC